MSQIYESGARQTDYYDRKVAFNLRTIRLAKGMSQEKLGNQLGVTFQQIQKLENGKNRIGAGRLYKLSLVLGCSVMDFFEGLEDMSSKGDIWKEILTIKDTRIVHAYQAIESQDVRDRILGLMAAISNAED